MPPGTACAWTQRLAMPTPLYHPRDTQDSVLVNVLRDHLDAFIEATESDGGSGLPPFVQRQLRAMVGCGDVTLGIARFECGSCQGSRVVPFSCKTRLCPSCAGRRMAEQSAHLVDRVMPRAPYRQWVLTFPWELARAVAYDADLCSRVFATFADEVGRWQIARARRLGIESSEAGSILEIQRFADGLQCFVHGHLLAPDGVFYETTDGEVAWRGLGPPTDDALSGIVTRVTERVARLLERRARQADDDEAGLSESALVLVQCADVRPCGRVLMEGAAAGHPCRRGPRRRKPLCVRSPEGLEIHAAVHVKAADRAGLERVVKYMSRPPICDDRLTRLPDDRIEVRLKRPRGGTRALLFEPHAFIARLAALIPLPGANMRRFYGVFSAAHRYRTRVAPRPPCPLESGRPVAPKRPAKMGWADLLARTWGLDSLRCPYCQGRLRFIAAIHQPSAIEAILAAINVAEGEAAEARRREIRERAPPSPVQAPA